MSSSRLRPLGRKAAQAAFLVSSIGVLAACGGDGEGSSSSSSSMSSSSSTSSVASSTSSSVSTSSSTSVSSSSSSSVSSSSSSSVPPVSSGTDGIFRVNAQGKITKNDVVEPIKCANWFGLEGQHEEDGGAPLELYIGNMWWDDTGRSIASGIADLQTLGITTIRVPISPETLIPGYADGVGHRDIAVGGNDNLPLKNKYDAYPYEDARSALEALLAQTKAAGINVMVDIHSCSSYVGWRAGRLDATPPYVDKDRGADYNFTREDHSCGAAAGVTVHPAGQPYGEARWLEDIKTIATLAKTYDNIIGIDIFNEPWDYTWDEWATLAERAYAAVEETENHNILMFVQGISGGNRTNEVEPHGSLENNPNWGENFFGFTERPLNIPRDRLVISPHTYGPSVYQQMQFMDYESKPECEGLHGEEAALAQCQMVMNTERLRAGWEEHFGFLRDMGYAVVIGEFGGNRHWPIGGGARESEGQLWGYLEGAVEGENNIDLLWQKEFVDYMAAEDIEGCYWGFNPESADTGGLFNHVYDTNTAKWGLWDGFDEVKLNMLQKIW